MATRVDPEQYSDTPIFRGLLRDRQGRWPGIPEGEEYDPPLEELVTTLEEQAATAPPAMYRVDPVPSDRPRPYVTSLAKVLGEETVSIPVIPHTTT